MQTLSSIQQYRISRRQFITSLVIAFVLHSLLIGALHHAPRQTAEQIPVRTLSVKLGNGLSGEEEMLLEQATIPEANAEVVEATLESAFPPEVTEVSVDSSPLEIRKNTPKSENKQKTQSTKNKEEVAAKPIAAKQYVRERVTVLDVPKGQGATLGNVETSPQMQVQEYTKTIALWLDKFKQYPNEAKAAGMQGRAMVRIRIDRRGNVHYRILSERTAYPLLDKAVLDMVRRANPVPAVPDDYPVKDDYLEFVIPVMFNLVE